MRSDFVGACNDLEGAFEKLAGSDETSTKVREALALLIDAVTLAEHSKRDSSAEILSFELRQSAGGAGSYIGG